MGLRHPVPAKGHGMYEFMCMCVCLCCVPQEGPLLGGSLGQNCRMAIKEDSSAGGRLKCLVTTRRGTGTCDAPCETPSCCHGGSASL